MTAIQRDHEVDDVIEATRVRAGIPSGTRYVLDALTFRFSDDNTVDATARAVAGIV